MLGITLRTGLLKVILTSNWTWLNHSLLSHMEDVCSSSKVGDAIDHRWYQLPCIQKPTRGLPLPKFFLIHMCIRWLCLHRQYLFLAISAESNELQNTAGLHNLRPNDVAAAEICTLGCRRTGTLRNNSMIALLGAQAV